MKKIILFALALYACCLNAFEVYKPEYSEYRPKLQGPPYSLSSGNQEKPLRTFTDEARKMWSDPVLQESIELGIKTNRMGDFFLYFRSSDGKPAKVENVKVNMLKHEFLFGAQAFNTKGFGGKKEMNTGDKFERELEISDVEAERYNELYEKEFANIFNFATLPFYWATSEPENGVYRFSKDSVHNNFRIAAPDTILEFTQKYGIVPKGHCLSWHVSIWSKPKWVKWDKREFEKYMCRYIKKVAERYDGTIEYWDVSNEITDERGNNNTASKNYNPHWFMPKDYALKAFKEAERNFSHSTKLISNYTTHAWQRLATYREYSSDWLSISHLIKSGAKVDIIGLQLHFFNNLQQNLFSGAEWGPHWMLAALDSLSDFNLPIHITELSFPCMSDKEYGEANQAFVTENFYKLWFSHKNVEAITYWYFVDGFNGSETHYNSGFLRRDFSRKPAYAILDRLINKEWRTDLDFKEVDGMVHFRAFYGQYKVSYTIGGKEKTLEVTLSKNAPKAWRIFIDANAQ